MKLFTQCNCDSYLLYELHIAIAQNVYGTHSCVALHTQIPLRLSQLHHMNSIIDIHTTQFFNRSRIHKNRTVWTSLWRSVDLIEIRFTCAIWTAHLTPDGWWMVDDNKGTWYYYRDWCGVLVPYNYKVRSTVHQVIGVSALITGLYPEKSYELSKALENPKLKIKKLASTGWFGPTCLFNELKEFKKISFWKLFEILFYFWKFGHR